MVCSELSLFCRELSLFNRDTLVSCGRGFECLAVTRLFCRGLVCYAVISVCLAVTLFYVDVYVSLVVTVTPVGPRMIMMFKFSMKRVSF